MYKGDKLDTSLLHQALTGQRYIGPKSCHFLADDGRKVACWVMGSGPLVIALSPGWGIGALYLQEAFAPLCENFTLLCITTRGTMPSDRPLLEDDMSSVAMAEDLEILRVLLGLQQIPVLVGHSNSAAITQAYAANYTAAVSKLVLICPQLLGSTPRDVVRQPFLTARAAHPVYRRAIPGMRKAALAENTEQLTEAMAQLIPYYFADPSCQAARDFQLTTATGTVDHWAWTAQNRADSGASKPDLKAIRAKTLIFLADEDPVCTQVWADEIHHDIAGSELVVLRSCGHLPWHESDIFLPKLTKFLSD